MGSRPCCPGHPSVHGAEQSLGCCSCAPPSAPAPQPARQGVPIPIQCLAWAILPTSLRVADPLVSHKLSLGGLGSWAHFQQAQWANRLSPPRPKCRQRGLTPQCRSSNLADQQTPLQHTKLPVGRGRVLGCCLPGPRLLEDCHVRCVRRSVCVCVCVRARVCACV